MTRITWTLLVLTALALPACNGDGTGPAGVTRGDGEMNFLRASVVAPDVQGAVSFYAVRGEGREALVYYRPAAGSGDSTEFLHFTMPARALVQRPDGTPIAMGDSLLITIRVVDPARFITEFEPAGLRFDPAAPARLEMHFAEADRDLDADGDEDALDVELTRSLAIWRQAAAGQPWTRLSSLLVESTKEVQADLYGFSNYAIAY